MQRKQTGRRRPVRGGRRAEPHLATGDGRQASTGNRDAAALMRGWMEDGVVGSEGDLSDHIAFVLLKLAETTNLRLGGR